jgi:hypothetical protein
MRALVVGRVVEMRPLLTEAAALVLFDVVMLVVGVRALRREISA